MACRHRGRFEPLMTVFRFDVNFMDCTCWISRWWLKFFSWNRIDVYKPCGCHSLKKSFTWSTTIQQVGALEYGLGLGKLWIRPTVYYLKQETLQENWKLESTWYSVFISIPFSLSLSLYRYGCFLLDVALEITDYGFERLLYPWYLEMSFKFSVSLEKCCQ